MSAPVTASEGLVQRSAGEEHRRHDDETDDTGAVIGFVAQRPLKRGMNLEPDQYLNFTVPKIVRGIEGTPISWPVAAAVDFAML